MSETLQIRFIPYGEFKRLQKAQLGKFARLRVIRDMCTLNALSAVKCAGSGHLGSSFSAMDIFVTLYFQQMNVCQLGIDSRDRDIFFSSKGHDCPGQYAVMMGAGILPFDQLTKLRRLGGLDGHPDVKIPGMEVNSGSLGMGIGKGKGMALAKKINGWGGCVFVMTGDGELHEGQIWESLQSLAHQKVHNITVLVDHNKIQSDKLVAEIVDLGDLEAKFAAFGWHVARCDGNDLQALDDVFAKLQNIVDKPKVLIADTIKGKGVSFMEGPTALEEGNGLYRWHSGAPDDDSYETGFAEVCARINRQFGDNGLGEVTLELVATREKNRVKMKDVAEKVVAAYGEALVEVGERRRDVVVLDADLSADCGLRLFENKFPERFVENGIAEQDMVSTAGGLALQGMLPIVNSFGVFLASRANEQIYNNASENTKIIYVCTFSGVIPAGPGKSHQSLRDISLFGALPNCVILEPCNAIETKAVLNWCVDKAKENCMIRLVISPSPRTIALPDDYHLDFAKGTVIRDGKDAIIFAYSPVMLHEVLIAYEQLAAENFSLKVVNMPWLNRVDSIWLEQTIGDCNNIIAVDNHVPYGGIGDLLLNEMMTNSKLRNKNLRKFAVEGYPACGTPPEVLQFHQLDGNSLAKRIRIGS